MQYLHTNNASSNLRNAVTVGHTSIVVTSGQGSLFPNPAVDQGFFVTVEDRRSGRLEIMLCTSRTGDTLTVQRGKQGTVPQSFVIGVSVANRITAQILNEFVAATVNEVPVDRIPPITSAMIVSLEASKLVGPGKVPVAVLPPITTGMITSLDAAKLTGVINPARITDVPAAALPNIPSANLTSVPAGNLTGTISVNRIANDSIPDAKISDLNAAKLTGTISEARFPTSFSVTGAVSVGNLTTDANLGVGNDLSANNITARPGYIITGELIHRNHGGYFQLGAYSSTYGSGYARIYFDENDNEVAFNGVSTKAWLNSEGYRGRGDVLTGVMKVDAGGIESPRMLLGPGGGHTSGSVYNGSSLATPNFMVDSSTTDLSISFGSGPGGTWRALQTGSGSAGQRCLGLFVRVT